VNVRVFFLGKQEDILGEIIRAEETAYTVMDGISKFFVSRAKVVTKVLFTLSWLSASSMATLVHPCIRAGY